MIPTPMPALGRLRPGLSLALVVCALYILLFPAATGPYSTVHGPVTALRALTASIAFLWLLSLTALLGSAAEHSFCYGMRSLLDGSFSRCESKRQSFVLRC
jgi:hypothetical protein